MAVVVVAVASGVVLMTWIAPAPERRPTDAQTMPPVEEPALPVSEEALREFHAQATTSASASDPALNPEPILQPSDQAGPATSLAAVEPHSTTNNDAEVAATQRMYMAHHSLRTSEEADPDSEANRQILQTMVQKALCPPSSK